MIRFRLAELIADAQFKTGRRIKLMDVAEATGINRVTLSRMSNVRGYGTSTDTIDKLCRYFGCQVGDVAQYVEETEALPEEKVATSASSRKTQAPRAATSKAPAKRKKT
jgi:putative transcriptional regulator